MNNSLSYQSYFLAPLQRAHQQAGVYLESRGELGLAPADAHLLSYLREYGPCRVGELAKVFGHKRPTLTGILDRLEDRGLLRRELNPDDRRSFLVHGTDAGKELSIRLGDLLRGFEDRLAARVTPRDYEGFREVMRAFEEITLGERGSPRDLGS